MKIKHLSLVILLIFSTSILFAQKDKNAKNEFQKALKTNTNKAYTDFINKYPSSKYVVQAKKARLKLDSIEIVISTFLGNQQHNYYGNRAPSKLDTIWKVYLGEGLSPAYGYNKVWAGAGWTGQPLFVREKGEDYIILGCFDYNLKKFKAKTGELVWEYKFDDILKATGSIWVNENAENIEERYIIMQGSRKGVTVDKNSKYAFSFRAVSYITGKEMWRYNSEPTDCYSRDVDASPVFIGDTSYIGLENGYFMVFDGDYKKSTSVDGYNQPKVYRKYKCYNENDIKAHTDDLCMESSPTVSGNRIYTPSGTGWIYGYNLTNQKIDWEFYIGADINGSCPVTDDNCLIVPIEKQYIKGNGGAMKIDPSKNPENAVVWFFPNDSLRWQHWEGGIVGSAAINDSYKMKGFPKIAAFIDVAGILTIVDTENSEENKLVEGPDGITKYKCPKLLAQEKLIGAISSPIIVEDKIVVATDTQLFLFQYFMENGKFKLKMLDKSQPFVIDATPIAVDGRIYLASRNGYFYCFGEK